MNSPVQKLDHAEKVRRDVAPLTAAKHKATLGQFLTPASVARFMASLFPASDLAECRLLDAGAGVGALSCAFLDRWKAGGFKFGTVKATAYEIDEKLCGHLEMHLSSYAGVDARVVKGDFIGLNTQGEFWNDGGYTHAILNPPYKKINTESFYRRALRTAGIETVNLYSAFVALVVELTAPGGQIVAIIPRSFCNGPYYRPFRDFILARAALRHMHLFGSRNSAFKDDAVLQENIILRLERGAQQGQVKVSTSTDDTFHDLATHEHPFERIVFPDDPERFIHVPTTTEMGAIEASVKINKSLADLGIKASTGPVVDFRLRPHLRQMPTAETAPLLYAGHFGKDGIRWPIPDAKKPNAILRNEQTEKWLYPNGYYCVVRRFSSKEEKRRIVASVVDPAAFGGAVVLGLENHLNVFHDSRKGLSKAMAFGLAAFLNTTAVDESFRRFNGHTQVNATDLKLMRYPARDALLALGEWFIQHQDASQSELDQQLESIS